MGLPRIQSYDLPVAAELPAARVPWQVDASRVALLIHDMQNYFLRAFEPPSPLSRGVLAHIAEVRDACVSAGVPVFYSAQPPDQDRRDRGLQSDFWGPGMGADASDHHIAADIAPADGHIVLTKWRYSAFQRTTLEPMLRARGRDQLLVCGVYAQIGCLLTAADAFMRDIEPFVLADAVADFSRVRHDAALAYAADRFAVVMTSAQACAALGRTR